MADRCGGMKRIHPVRLAIPAGSNDRCRRCYVGVLGHRIDFMRKRHG
jgi:hypothetical protein